MDRDVSRAHMQIPIVQFNLCYNIGYIQGTMRMKQTKETVRCFEEAEKFLPKEKHKLG